MSSYKKNASSNRDALFGSAGSKSKGKKKGSSTAEAKNELFGSAASSSGSRPAKTAASTTSSSQGYAYGGLKGKQKKKQSKAAMLSPEARATKIKEAEEYKAKAKKCMSQGLFKRAEPVMASSFFKRAADAYQLAGDERQERFARLSSADCQLAIGAYATAASEYTRAAELVVLAEDEPIERRRQDASDWHKKSAEAWRQQGDAAKAAACMLQSAVAMLTEDTSEMMSKDVLAGLEEAVESHCPDPLNPYARYRQTGVSAFVDPDSEETATNPSQQTLEMANNHVLNKAYAHEPLLEIIYLLVNYGEYSAALYAAGACSTLLARDGVSTISLSRAFVTETILTLAMGDPIAAEQNFLKTHVQKSVYLSSRECKLAEDLFRAVKMRDLEALDEARSPQGSNRAVLANLHPKIRELVHQIRTSGVARRGAPPEVSTTKKDLKDVPTLAELATKKTGYEGEEGEEMNAEDLAAELDALDFGNDGDDASDDLSDDDIDLR